MPQLHQAISEEIAEVEREMAEKEGKRSVPGGEDDNRKIRRSISAKLVRPRAIYFVVLSFLFTQASQLLPAVFLEVFTVTFLAEWGDRSQIVTIGACCTQVVTCCSNRTYITGLAIDYDIFSVTLGGVLGHAICTGAAVLGGRHLASHIDERAVSVVGGLLFLGFGVHALVEGV